VNQGRDFTAARRVIRQHYQHLVIHDYLTRVADPAVVDGILTGGNRFYHPEVGRFFLPLEFAVTGFRFGHTMVRNFPDADLFLLFTFTALSGELGGGGDRLPENWIIQWDRFIPEDGGLNKARRFDTKLADGLFQLQTIEGETDDKDDQRATVPDRPQLAIRNLLRGYALRMPTGQALAKRMQLPVLTPAQIKAAAASTKQADKLGEAGFLERTPLWYYLLAEAKHKGGHRLGPVGSTLVAEVLIGLVRRSEDSILGSPGWKWTLPSTKTDRFVLADLLRFARVAGDASTKIYTVKRGDTVKSIAKAQLGDEKRWPEIFALERDKIGHRDKPLTVGTVFALPKTPSPPKSTLHRTQSGDTLSKMAKRLLGDANRFPEIHRLNRDVLPANPDDLPVGLDLVVVRD